MSDHQREKVSTHVDKDLFFCDTCDNELWPCPTRILIDLIAELRKGATGHRGEPCCEGKHAMCNVCDGQEWPCWPAYYATLANRAEARLREVTGDDSRI